MTYFESIRLIMIVLSVLIIIIYLTKKFINYMIYKDSVYQLVDLYVKSNKTNIVLKFKKESSEPNSDIKKIEEKYQKELDEITSKEKRNFLLSLCLGFDPSFFNHFLSYLNYIFSISNKIQITQETWNNYEKMSQFIDKMSDKK